MDDWKPYKFSDVLDVPLKNGLTKPSRIRGEGVKMVNMGELFEHDRLQNAPMERVPFSNRERESYLLKIGDLLFARQSLVVSGAGKCSIFLGDNEDVTFEGHLIRARANSNIADPLFLYYYFRSPIGRNNIESIVEFTAAAGIRGSDLARLRIDLPSPAEQGVIGRVLDSLDRKIELNRRMNVTLEAMARALFKAWFVDFEPVHANKENRPSTSASPEIAKLFPSDFENGIPKGWRIGTLSEIATNFRQNIDPSGIDAETPYVGLEHIPRGSLALTEWGMASEAESIKSDFRTNDILFGKLRPYFHKVVIAPVDGICSTDVLVVRPISKHHFGQAVIQFSSEALIQYATQLSNGAKMPRTSWSDLAKFETVIPSTQVSEAYASFVASITRRILSNISQSKTLEETRDALLPCLISGKITIGEVEKSVTTL